MPYQYRFKVVEITHPIAVCMRCFKVVKPTARRYSKNGAQGEWCYVHEHPLLFVILKQDGAGRREVRTAGRVPGSLAHLVREVWVERGVDIFFVEDAVREWLYLAKQGREEDLVIVEVNGNVELVEAGDW
jgi:hypothetical protein